MTDDEILDALLMLPDHQQVMTRTIWERAGSMRVCWICGDDKAEELELNSVGGYFCENCYKIQTTMFP